MAPRVGATASGVGDPAFRFLLSVLKHCEQVKPDWNEVAKENGIAWARNASARFKSIIEQNGLKFENGSILIPEDAEDGGVIAATKASPTLQEDNEPNTPRRAKKTATRKRKADAAGADDDDDDDEEKAAPAAGGAKKGGGTKKKPQKSMVKVEEDADADGDQQSAPAVKDGPKTKTEKIHGGSDNVEDETRAAKRVKTEDAQF
ncbi:hypothetical protein Z517_10725 [Fonsecaea pedrosoi CBS 271.37]|uniref:Myb-like DNA-binding domain-containing protein n=1 Tax=Fonsecaea pedrosoi CBS 271.37 TaxID=1442368 RepID=A0A0D2GB37_9EURO|nr:uncharacterized protein Z517_10725 [Fonsecaea pedrosoi CBS 271.37]KIW75980.1 hypothetical protein Z517_10725 [Fonsecaea pedrosoi CBS 271.37]